MPDLTYPGAPSALVKHWEKRRAPLALGADEVFPPQAPDWAALLAARLPDPLPPLPEGASPHARKRHEVAAEFPAGPELFVLHGLAIAHLRKRRAPKGTAAFFRRIWTETAGPLIAGLPARWLISAAITFGEHGVTEEERLLGRELGMLFSLMKLYEFERLFGGTLPDRPFRAGNRAKAPLPLGMEPFSLVDGGLDINLLAPLWLRAEAEPVLGPLARALLDQLNADPGNLFRRLSRMRARRAGRAAKGAPPHAS
jgi:hypothetical protein